MLIGEVCECVNGRPRRRESVLGKPSRTGEACWHKLSKSTALEKIQLFSRVCVLAFKIASLKYENYYPWLRSASLATCVYFCLSFFFKLFFFLWRDPRNHRHYRSEVKEEEREFYFSLFYLASHECAYCERPLF